MGSGAWRRTGRAGPFGFGRAGAGGVAAPSRENGQGSAAGASRRNRATLAQVAGSGPGAAAGDGSAAGARSPRPLYVGGRVCCLRLRRLAGRLNDTPRRCLGYRTPREVFEAHLVAPTGPP